MTILSKFSECGVFSSRVDYFCLVCECRLRDEGDAAAHIAKPVHTKKFDLTEYFEDEQECVRKIKKWYLCELCNLVLPTAARVRLHVVEATHVENRVDRALQRNGSCVVAFSRVQVDDRAWNGIVDDTCAICNTEFDDEHIHRNETSHILKLIQSKVEFDEGQNLYRRVDDSSFHCLTCNTVIALSSMVKHFNENDHKNYYQRCCNNLKIATTLETNDIPNVTEGDKNGEKKEIDVATKVPDVTSETSTSGKKKNNILNKEKRETEPSTVNSDASKTKKNNEKSIDNLVNSAPIDDKEICEILNAKDYIVTSPDGETRCIICNFVIDPSTTKSHINDLHHQTLLQLHKTRLSNLNIKKNLNDNSPIVKSESDAKIIDVDNVGSILHSVEKFQKHGININFEIETAVCKKCSKQLDFNIQAIEDHVQVHAKIKNEKKDHKPIQLTSGCEVTKREEGMKETSLYTTPIHKKDKQQKKVDTKEAKKESSPIVDLDEIEIYAKQNYMTYLTDENKVHCNKCNTKITPSLKTLKEHVVGVGHKKMLNKEVTQVVNAKSKSKQTNKEVNLTKIPISSFVITAVTIDLMQKEVIINEKFCISLFSLVLMVRQYNRFMCLVCDCDVLMQNFKLHIDTTKHENLVDSTPVVIEHENEFIREFKPGCYHCGYCNVPIQSWGSMEAHLESAGHKECRIAAQWRLQQFLPEIAKHRLQKEMQEKFMMQMMFSSMFGGRNTSYNSDSD